MKQQIERRRCSQRASITQAYLLSSLARETSSEVQTLWIQPKDGLPDGGSFVLSLDGVKTSNISYDHNYNYVESTMRLALNQLAEIDIVGRSSTEFLIKFVGNDAGKRKSLLKLEENNLTLSGSPAGLIQIARKSEGGLPRNMFSTLQNIPLDKWVITSFNPNTREFCIAVENNVTTTYLSGTLPELI